MTARLALRVLTVAIASAVFFPRPAAASHLQGGTISWEREEAFPNEVRYKVHVELALRWSFYLNTPTGVPGVGSQLPDDTADLVWGPVSSQQGTHVSVPMFVSSISPIQDQDWLIASGTVTIAVPLDSPALRLTVEDCCHSNALAEGNGDTDQVLEAIIPVLNPLTVVPSSPRAVSLPRIFFEQGKPAELPLASLPGRMYYGLTLPFEPPLQTLPNHYRPTPHPSSMGPSIPTDMVLDENTGLITWTPAAAGLYDIRITIDNSYGASIPLEFMVQVLPTPSTRVEFAPGVCGGQVTGYLGTASELLISAASTARNDSVTIATSALPQAVVSLGTPNPYHIQWSPNVLDIVPVVPPQQVCFTATSAAGAVSLGQCCVYLHMTDAQYTPPCKGSGVPAHTGVGYPIRLARYVVAGQIGTLDIMTSDECGNLVTTGGYGERIGVRGEGTTITTPVPIDLGNGIYRFYFTTPTPGRIVLELLSDGIMTEMSPNIDVLASPTPLCTTWSDCPSGLCSGGVCAVDAIAPQVEIDNAPQLTNQPELELVATGTDDGHIDSATVVLNGTPVGDPLAPDDSGMIAVPITLVEGLNTVLVQYRDHAGNVGGALSEITLDTVPPLVSFFGPLPYQVVGSAIIDTTVRVLDASATVTRVNQGTPLPAAPGMTVLSTTVPASASGTFTLTATASDAAGNVKTISEDVVVDLEAPDVSTDIPNGVHLGPLGGAVLPFNVTVNSLAATTVVVSSGGAFQLPRGGGMVSTTVALVEGPNAITIVATDELGRRSEIQRSVVFDSTPPDGVILYPTQGEVVRGVIEPLVQVGADLSGPASVAFSLDGAAIPSGSLDTSLLADGAHTLLVTLADSVENTRTLSARFVSDNRAPSVAVVSPPGYVHGSINVTADAADAGSGVASLELLVNGASIGTCNAPHCVQSFDTTMLADGPFVVSARASDLAGNTASSADVTLTAVNSVPSHFIVNPSTGAVIRTSTLAIDVAAPAAFFASAECFFDGTSLGVSSAPSFSRTVDLATVLDGRSTVRCEVRNVAGAVAIESVDVAIDRWEVEIKPSNLNVRNGQGGNASVEVEVRGPGAALLLPIAGRSLALTVPGGTPVLARAGSTVGVTGRVKIEFDRAALVSSIAAGIAGKFIDANEPLNVSLYSDRRLIGGGSIRLIH